MDKKPEEVTTPQPTAPAAPAEQPMPPVVGSKKSKTGLIVGIVVAVLVVVAAIAVGVWIYVTNTPDYLLQGAVTKLSKSESVAGKFTLQNGTASNGMTITGDMALKGDSKNTKNGELIVGLGTGSTRVGLNVLTVDDTLYLKGTTLDHLGALLKTFSPTEAAQFNTTEFKSFLKQLNGQWFSVSPDEMQSLTSSGSVTVTGTDASEIPKVLDIYQKHAFIKSDKTFADEKIEGVNSMHFNIKVDKATYVEFLEALKAANLKSFKITDADITEARNKGVDTTTTSVDIWIGRDTKAFTQVRLNNTKKNEEMALTFTFAGTLPTFDKFEEPADTKSITELFMALFGTNTSTVGTPTALQISAHPHLKK